MVKLREPVSALQTLGNAPALAWLLPAVLLSVGIGVTMQRGVAHGLVFTAFAVGFAAFAPRYFPSGHRAIRVVCGLLLSFFVVFGLLAWLTGLGTFAAACFALVCSAAGALLASAVRAATHRSRQDRFCIDDPQCGGSSD